MIEKWCFYNRINWLCFKWDILMEAIRLYRANLKKLVAKHEISKVLIFFEFFICNYSFVIL
jgi:hypothetical protein